MINSAIYMRYTCFYPLLILSLLSIPVKADKFLRLDYSYSQIRQEPMKDYNALPSGSGYGIIVGGYIKQLGLEFLLRQTQLETDIMHDNIETTLIHKQITYGAAINVFLNRRLYIKFGYALHQIRQETKEAYPEATQTAVNEQYGLIDNKSKSGIYYGFGFNIFGGETFDLVLNLVRYDLSRTSYELASHIGLQYYFNFTLFDIK